MMPRPKGMPKMGNVTTAKPPKKGTPPPKKGSGKGGKKSC
jgi:hypothetical protein